MIVKATNLCEQYGVVPIELDIIPKEGHVFEVSEERYKVLAGNNRFNRCFVVPVEAPATKKKKSTVKKKTKSE